MRDFARSAMAGTSRSRNAALMILAPVVLVGLVFAATLHFPYVWDDEVIMTERWFQGPGDLQMLLTPSKYFAVLAKRSYRPAATLWEGLLQFLNGHDVALARGAVLGLHAGNAFLLSRLVLSLGAGSGGALVAGAVLAVHPVNVEPVPGMTASADLLATAGVLLVLLAWRNGWAGLACAGLVLGAFAKETALVALALLPLHDRLIRHETWREVFQSRRRAYVIMAVAAAGYLLCRFVLFVGPVSRASYIGNGFLANIMTMLQAVAHGLRLLVAPFLLLIFHEVPVVQGGWTVGVTLALAGLSGWLLAAWTLRRQPLVAFGLLWALIGLLPVLNIVPFLKIAGLAERYLYLSTCGLALAIGGLWSWQGTRPVVRWALLLALVAGVVGARRHTEVWADPIRFYESIVAGAPGLLQGHLGLSKAFLGLGRLRESETAANRALELDPQHPAATAYLGMVAFQEGRMREAVGNFKRAIQLAPRDASHYYRLGLALEWSGQPERASEAYRAALRLDPRYQEPAIRIGAALLLSRKPREAAAWMERVVAMHSDAWRAWDVLGAALVDSGRVKEGVGAYERAIALGGSSPSLLNAMGKVLLADGQTEKATRAFQDALMMDPGFAPARRHLDRILQSHRDK